MLDFHRLHPQIGVLTGRVVFDNGRLQSAGLDVVGPEGVHDRGCAITEAVGQRTADTRVERPPATEVPLVAKVAEVDAAIGCCQLFSAALAREIGGWDPGWSPVWFEDFDFALSARRLGFKVFYLPDVRIVHRVHMRNPRESGRRWEAALLGLRRGVGRYAPRNLRAGVARIARLGDLDPQRRTLLAHHYAYFARKWGFDPSTQTWTRCWPGTATARFAGPMTRGCDVRARTSWGPGGPQRRALLGSEPGPAEDDAVGRRPCARARSRAAGRVRRQRPGSRRELNPGPRKPRSAAPTGAGCPRRRAGDRGSWPSTPPSIRTDARSHPCRD